MEIIISILIGFIAFFHLYILWFEMFAWESKGPKVFKKFPNSKTMPQVVIDNKHIGGYNDLEKWLAFNIPDEDF